MYLYQSKYDVSEQRRSYEHSEKLADNANAGEDLVSFEEACPQRAVLLSMQNCREGLFAEIQGVSEINSSISEACSMRHEMLI